MSPVFASIRPVLRGLARSPGFALVAVLTLAVGIGANIAVFSVVDAILIEPLPFAEPDRLVGVWHTAPGLGWDQANQAPALYFTYRDHSEVFEESGMWDDTRVSITGVSTAMGAATGSTAVSNTEHGEPEQVQAIQVTDGIMPLLGVRPLLGRVFGAEDDAPGAAQTVVLSHGYWQQRLGGVSSAIGQLLTVDGEPHEVIGVMRKDLQFLDYDPALYLPMRLDRGEVKFGNFSYQGIARLRPGMTIEQANAELTRLLPMAIENFPMPPGFTAAMVEEVGFAPRVQPLEDEVVGDVGNVLWLLLGTVGLVLLVACANVANLLLVRAEGRQQEVAVRAALGAGWRRIGGRLLIESLTLALVGGIAGLGLAWLGIRALVTHAPRGLPRLDEIAIDPSVLVFALVISLLSAGLVTVLPLLRLGRLDLVNALKEGGRGASTGRGRNRARDALVACQIAIALVLLIGSGLMARSLWSLSSIDPGFKRPAEVLTVRLAVTEAEAAEGDQVVRLYERLYQRLARIPGIESVGLSSSITMDGWDSYDPVFVEDFPLPADQIPPLRRFKWIAPGYFETMGNELLVGRSVTWDDLHQRRPVALVTESLAAEFWPEPSAALGRRIRVTPEDPWREIIGVVGNVRDDGVTEEATDVVFWPMAMAGFWGEELYVPRSLAFALRSPRVGAAALLGEVRQAIWEVNDHLPLANVRTLEEILDRSLARTSFTLVMLAVAAIAAVLLGAIGIYGVTSYAVSQRRREIGVRMAFGARPREVSRLILRHGLLLAGVGVVIGLAGSLALTRLMSAILYGVSPLDPVTYGAGGAGVVIIVLLASYIPARRAASVDPIETLRAD
jgi:predicted permease